MSIPTRDEAAQILTRLVKKQKLINHSAATAEVCAFMCAALAKKGVEVNSTLAETAALLHDIDKGLPLNDPYRALGHGAAGAQWLVDHGHKELADAVRGHPVNIIGAMNSYKDWLKQTTLESRLVAFADKRALQDVVSLDARFERWYKRYPDSPMEPIAHDRFRRLERELCAMAGIKKADVKRLPWVDAAISAARVQ
jgi:putative nucleotidyltransferase with HDIG domain